MQMRKYLRSTGALFLTLALLAGMVSVMGAFPVVAAKSVETFKADFSALPSAVVDMADTDTVEYLESKFAFYYAQEGWYFERPDVNGYVIDADGNYVTTKSEGVTTYLPDVADQTAASAAKWVDGVGWVSADTNKGNANYGVSQWGVTGKWLYCTGYSAAGNAFRKFNSAWVKADDGEKASLDNFKLEMDFKPATSSATNLDSVAIVFRAKSAGNPFSADQQMVSLAPDGGLFVGTLEKAFAVASYPETMEYAGAAVTFDRSVAYHLTLTVIGTEMTVKVTNGEKVVYELTRAVKDTGSGYLGIGGSNAGAQYGNIEVTRLDAGGNPVDFNDHNDGCGFGADFQRIADYRDDNSTRPDYFTGYYRDNGADLKWLAPVGGKTYTFDDPANHAADQAVVDYLDSKFDFYYNRESFVTKFDTPYENSSVQDEDSYDTSKKAQWKLQNGRYLNAVFTGQGGEILRKTMSLVPKTSDGAVAEMKNLVTEFDINMATTAKTGVAFTFRAVTAGKLTSGYKTSLDNKITVIFTSSGWQLYEGVMPKDDCVTPVVNAWEGGATVTAAHVYIKAVEDTFIMRVTGTDGTVYYDNTKDPIEISYAESGCMFYSVLNGTGGFADIRIDRLHTDGSVAGWDMPGSLAMSIYAETRPTYTMTAGDDISTHLNTLFNTYYDLDGTLTNTGGFPSTATTGAYFQNIYERQNLETTFASGSTNQTSHLKSVATLVPKTADGNEAVLKNFELSFTTRWAENTFNNSSVGAFVIGFRQQAAGKITTGAGTVNKDQGLIVISSKGVSIAGGDEITDDMYGLDNEQTFASELNPKASSDLTYYQVTVRVVGNKVTVMIGNNTYTDTINYDEAGYLAFGPGAYRFHFSDVTVTRLDDVGNAVDWNEKNAEIIPSGVTITGGSLLGFNTTYANKFPNNAVAVLLEDSALTVAQRAEFLEYMNSRFDVYYNDYDGTNVTYLHQNSVAGNTVGYNYDELMYYQHVWLRPNAAADGYGEMSTGELRQVGSLVVKDDDGEPLYLKNFELHTAFEHEGASATGSSIIGFRQEAPGRYYTDTGDAAVGSYLQISNGVVSVVENGTVLHTKECTAIKPAAVADVSLKVVGNTLTYSIKSTYGSGNGTVYSDTVTLSTARYGYFSLGQTNYRHYYDITGTTITALDDVGNPTPIKDADSKYMGGNITVRSTEAEDVYTNTITVTANEGYELLAGSLIATDAAGNSYVPERVGFREYGTADQYVVVCNSPVTANGTFVQPSVSDPNIGNIGTSINKEVNGLRFVSRFNRSVDENGEEYVTFDGVRYTVKDYGMLVGLDRVIGSNTLDLALAEADPCVLKLSVPEEQVYYDLCDDYVDMSVCIVNLQNIPDGLALNVVSRPYAVLEDAQGNDIEVYAKKFDSTYEESAGIQSTSFAELFANEQIIRHGRADMVNGEYQMDWVNTGFEVSGELVGSVKVEMVSARADSLLNVVVDGGKPAIVHVPNGTSTVTLASDLKEGQHTIKVISGTSLRQGTLSATRLQYIGTLDTVERAASKLRITVLGDSISCGWGMGVLNGGTYTTAELIAGSNAYDSYATITANNLDAYLDVVAQCSQTISEIHGYSQKLNKRTGAPAWNWEEQDIIVVNLGTNDEWRSGFTAATALTDATALLEDMRDKNPDAYIIYVYSMMTDYTQNYADYLVSYKAAVQSLVDKGDDKVFMLQMTPNRVGYEGHPDTAAHAGYAEVLTAFIKENCSDLFGHETHTETLAELEANDTVIFSGRTAASDTARTMIYSNTGITIDGYLYGDLTMDVTVASNACALNVVIDGDTDNMQTVWVDAGSRTVTLVEDLRRGYHTIEITKGTAHHAGLLTMKSITYTGTLETPTEKALQLEFIGDSVTVGEGMYGAITPLAKSYNGFDGYAAQVARYFDAGVSTVAQCGARIPDMATQFNDSNWSFADHQKDIVVINLGTNDFGWSSYADYDITTAYYPTTTSYSSIKMKDAITGLIDDVRTAYPDAYIVWTYGMMFDQHMDALEGIVQTHATETADEKLLFCDLSAAKDTSGNSSHPSTVGNNNAAILLAAFIRENCAELLPTTPAVEKTYATDRQLKIACVGDSITAGGYWSDNMRGELSTDNYAVQGFGVSGSTALFNGVDYVNATTNAGKAYVDQTAYADSLAYGADAVVVMLGTNDSKDVNWPYYGHRFVDNYTQIVRSYQNSDSAPTVFIALPPTVYSTGSFQGISNPRIENYIIPALKEVAARTGAILIDTHTPTSGNSALMTDGVHPGDDGKQILCETIAAAIKQDTGRE